MAFDTGVFSVDGSLILDPTGYTSGGTDLGIVGSVHRAGFQHAVQTLRKQNYGAEHVDARILGTNILYQIIVEHRSTDLTEILFHNRAVSDAYGDPSFNRGKLVTSDETVELLVRPATTTKPMLYFPRAFLIACGPVLWARRAGHHLETVLTFIGLRDGSTTAPFYYGDYNQFPALGGGGD